MRDWYHCPICGVNSHHSDACGACYEVMKNLARFVRFKNGRVFVMNTIVEDARHREREKASAKKGVRGTTWLREKTGCSFDMAKRAMSECQGDRACALNWIEAERMYGGRVSARNKEVTCEND